MNVVTERPCANANPLQVGRGGFFVDSHESEQELPRVFVSKNPSSIFVSHLIVTSLDESNTGDKTLAPLWESITVKF